MFKWFWTIFSLGAPERLGLSFLLFEDPITIQSSCYEQEIMKHI